MGWIVKLNSVLGSGLHARLNRAEDRDTNEISKPLKIKLTPRWIKSQCPPDRRKLLEPLALICACDSFWIISKSVAAMTAAISIYPYTFHSQIFYPLLHLSPSVEIFLLHSTDIALVVLRSRAWHFQLEHKNWHNLEVIFSIPIWQEVRLFFKTHRLCYRLLTYGSHHYERKNFRSLFRLRKSAFHGFSNPCAVNNYSFSKILIVRPSATTRPSSIAIVRGRRSIVSVIR